MTTYLSLFRGINVGGHHQVKMTELKALHETLGFQHITTYIQSGNVIFTADDIEAGQLARRIEDAFALTFGFQSSVIVRSAAEVTATIINNPFPQYAQSEPKLLMAVFLAAQPEQTAVEALRKAHSGPEEFQLNNREFYIFYVDGSGRSKFTLPLIEKKLGTIGTSRNWNTVLQLQKMMG